MEIKKIITVIFSLIFILFLPGLCWSFVFFAHKKIDAIERFALSVALSLTLVPLTVFYFNLLGLPINRQNVLVTVILICSTACLIILIKQIRRIYK